MRLISLAFCWIAAVHFWACTTQSTIPLELDVDAGGEGDAGQGPDGGEDLDLEFRDVGDARLDPPEDTSGEAPDGPGLDALVDPESDRDAAGQTDSSQDIDDTGEEPDGIGGFVRYPADRIQSPITASVARRLRDIAALDTELHDDVFMKVGASGTVSSYFMHCFDGGPIDLDGRDALQATIDHFLAGDGNDLGTTGDLSPFNRDTYAAEVGRTAAWALSGDPSPVDREIAAILPRFGLVNYGTNDMNMGLTYASAMWNFYESYSDLLDHILARGIVPIVTNILPRGDSAAADLWVPTYNAVIRGIAQARQIPHVDFHLAVQPLDGYGLSSDGLHANVYRESGSARPCIFTATGLEYGYNVRNLITIQALDRAVAAVLTSAEAPDEVYERLDGDGSPEDPFVIDGLPFTHLADTLRSPHIHLDEYTGCAASQDESGPEFLYRWTATRRTAIRALVLVREGVDIDLHLLDGTGTEEGCIERAHRLIEGTVEAGEYIFSLDTWVDSSGDELAGEYLFVVLECTAGDVDCRSTLD